MTTRHKQTAPRLRFQGFDGAWEEKTIFELAQDNKLNNGVFNDRNKAGRGYKLINVLDMYLESSIDENTLQLLDLERNEFLRNKVIYGDVFFTRSSLVKEGIAYSNVYLGNSDDITYDGHLIKLTPNQNLVNPIFLNYELKTTSVRQQFITGGKTTTMTTIGQQEIGESTVILPQLSEQTRLGNFFRELDHRIAQSRALCEKSRRLKKAMLAKMFPAAGETAPKIRFKGFTGEWERKMLGEVVEKIKSYPLSRNIETSEHTGFKYIHYGDIHRGIADIIYSDKVLPNIQAGHFEYLKNGDVIVADVSEDYEGVGAACVIDGSLKNKVVSGLHTIAIRPREINHLFLYYLFKTQAFKQYGRLIGTGTKVVGITANRLMDFQAYIPTHPEEQTAIGNFFRQLDDTIALHALETEKLGHLKKALLAAMLV